MRLKDKVAVITGAAGGIGLAIAQRFAAEGAVVVLTDIQAEKGEAEAAAIGIRARFMQLDAANEAEVEALVARIEAEVGPVDIAVCSAGFAGPQNHFHESRIEDFEAVMRLNLYGPYLMGRAVCRRMVETGRTGSVINISSVGGKLGVAKSYAYCTSKAALDMLTKTMALSMAPHNIRVNAIGPGVTASPMTDHLSAEARTVMLSRTPLGRLGETSEMAGVAVFLASEDASYVTGQTIYAEGGRLALNYVMDPKAP
jgi:NAD(P)-dependent dehydrogenase (short-subunit alcohol dehydrogenase family)